VGCALDRRTVFAHQDGAGVHGGAQNTIKPVAKEAQILIIFVQFIVFKSVFKTGTADANPCV
jgi:hypothetical protein